jgi:putative transposase
MHWQDRRMCRPALNEPGHAHELTFTCFRGYAFLKAERTCQWLADAVNEARQEFDFALWAYVFMPEHVHLLIWPRQPVYQVSKILAAIKEPVARSAIAYMSEHSRDWLRRIRVKSGQRQRHRFWQAGGGFDNNATDPHVLLRMIEYIHLNPVRRELVLKAEDWKWSSAGWQEEKNSLRPDQVDFGGLTGYFGGQG